MYSYHCLLTVKYLWTYHLFMMGLWSLWKQPWRCHCDVIRVISTVQITTACPELYFKKTWCGPVVLELDPFCGPKVRTSQPLLPRRWRCKFAAWSHSYWQIIGCCSNAACSPSPTTSHSSASPADTNPCYTFLFVCLSVFGRIDPAM